MKKIALLITLSLIIVSCQKSYYTYENSQTVANTKNQSYPIHMQMAYRGLKESQKDRSYAMKFDLLAQNLGDKEVALEPGSYYLVDQDGKRFEPLVRKEHEKLKIAPNTSTTFPVFYRLAKPEELKDIKSFQLVWNYSAEETNHEMMTKFDKKRLRYEKDYFGYPYSASFYQGPVMFKRLGHGPLWRYQNLERRRGGKRRR